MKTIQDTRPITTATWLAGLVVGLAILTPATATQTHPARAALVNLPLAFETSPDRAPAQVRFLARGQGYRLCLGRNDFEVVLAARETGGCLGDVRTACLHASLIGAADHIQPEAV